jgi:hypothetical protein
MNTHALHYECLLLERLLYKSKNQHRRTAYFKKLQLVKRTYRRFRKLNETSSQTEAKMKSLHDGFRLLEFGQKASMAAFLDCKREASHSYFMAVNMMFMAVLSSIYSESQQLLETIPIEYARLYDVCPNKSEWPSRLVARNSPVKVLSTEDMNSMDKQGSPSGGSSHVRDVDGDGKIVSNNRIDSPHTKNATYRASLLMQQQSELSESLFNDDTEPTTRSDSIPPASHRKKKSKSKRKKLESDEIDDLFAQFM